MSVVLQLAGKKYTITSATVDQDLLEKAAGLFDEAAAEIHKAAPALSEGQLCAMVAMRCLVPLLQKQRAVEHSLETHIEELSKALEG